MIALTLIMFQVFISIYITNKFSYKLYKIPIPIFITILFICNYLFYFSISSLIPYCKYRVVDTMEVTYNSSSKKIKLALIERSGDGFDIFLYRDRTSTLIQGEYNIGDEIATDSENKHFNF